MPTTQVKKADKPRGKQHDIRSSSFRRIAKELRVANEREQLRAVEIVARVIEAEAKRASKLR